MHAIDYAIEHGYTPVRCDACRVDRVEGFKPNGPAPALHGDVAWECNNCGHVQTRTLRAMRLWVQNGKRNVEKFGRPAAKPGTVTGTVLDYITEHGGAPRRDIVTHVKAVHGGMTMTRTVDHTLNRLKRSGRIERRVTETGAAWVPAGEREP